MEAGLQILASSQEAVLIKHEALLLTLTFSAGCSAGWVFDGWRWMIAGFGSESNCTTRLKRMIPVACVSLCVAVNTSQTAWGPLQDPHLLPAQSKPNLQPDSWLVNWSIWLQKSEKTALNLYFFFCYTGATEDQTIIQMKKEKYKQELLQQIAEQKRNKIK